jgi:hypothetical protein
MLELKQAVGPDCPNLKDDVLLVQGLLNQADPKPAPPLKVDGDPGSKTLAELTLFIERGMTFCPVGGVRLEPGSPHWERLRKPTELPRAAGGAKLIEEDFTTAATTLQCEVACIKAVNDVESGRIGGYFASGRPVILFEAHLFSKFTGHKYDQVLPDISSRKWNKKLYRGGEAEYDRLEKAMAFDRAAALQSASWGRFQIMGFNHASAGYATVEDFVTAMYQSEARHLEAFLAFLRASHLDDELREKKWAQFAAGYNGKSYADNQYDVKLQKAYERYAAAAQPSP